MPSVLDGPPSLAGPHTTGDAAFVKNMVHVFQLEAHRLRKEDVDEWNPQGVEDGEDDKRAPLNVADGDGGDLHHRKDTHLVDEAGQRLALGADPGGGDLRRVEPGDGEVADAEEISGRGTPLRWRRRRPIFCRWTVGAGGDRETGREARGR